MSLANKMAKANYQGDPGLLGDIWGGISKVGRIASGIVGGLGIPIVSGVARTAGGMLFGQGSARNAIPGATTFNLPGGGTTVNTASQGGSRPGVGISLMDRVRYAGGALAPGGWEPGMAVAGQGPSPAASGYHWNKTGYYTKSDGWIEPYSRMVKNRRRNPGNMRALSRSMGRIKSAKKMAKALSNVTIRDSCAKR